MAKLMNMLAHMLNEREFRAQMKSARGNADLWRAAFSCFLFFVTESGYVNKQKYESHMRVSV
jgi:hypothetical protein